MESLTAPAVAAYGRRAEEYAQALGSIEAMAAPDRARIRAWAAGIDGPLLDLGCGPGHWTADLQSRGRNVLGIDPSEEMIQIARRRHPGTAFALGSVEQPGAAACQRMPFAGILAWYSLIHHAPKDALAAIAGMAGMVAPGGEVLLGFFEGESRAPFAHAVSTAWAWPADELADALAGAGWRVLDIARRTDPGARPHADIRAVRR